MRASSRLEKPAFQLSSQLILSIVSARARLSLGNGGPALPTTLTVCLSAAAAGTATNTRAFGDLSASVTAATARPQPA